MLYKGATYLSINEVSPCYAQKLCFFTLGGFILDFTKQYTKFSVNARFNTCLI